MGRPPSGARGVDASGLRISGFYAHDKHREPVQGQHRELHAARQGYRSRRRRADPAERIFPRAGAAAQSGALLRDRRTERHGQPPHRRLYSPRAAAVGRSGVRTGAPGRLAESAASLRASGKLRLAPAPSGDAVTRRDQRDVRRREPARSTWDAPRSACRIRALDFSGAIDQRAEGPRGDQRPQRPAARAGQERRRHAGEIAQRIGDLRWQRDRQSEQPAHRRPSARRQRDLRRRSMWIRWRPTWWCPPIICACRTPPPRRGRCARSSRARWD